MMGRNWTTKGLILAAITVALGCGDKNQTASPKSETKPESKPVAKTETPPKKADEHDNKTDGDKTTDAKKPHDHSGWWCDEHGVPEAECSMCNSKVAAELKKKGDWCDKHDRAKSQCFICDPKAKEKYAAMYRAKLGKEPPPVEDEKKEEKKSGT